MHYHVGWNLSGYMPEMDPYIVGDIETAITDLSDEIEQVVDSLASVVDSLEDEDADPASVEELKDAERLWEELGAVKRTIANGEDDGYAQFGWDGTIRYVHYWVLPCPIDACETNHCAECGQDVTAYWRDARGEPTCEECERELFIQHLLDDSTHRALSHGPTTHPRDLDRDALQRWHDADHENEEGVGPRDGHSHN